MKFYYFEIMNSKKKISKIISGFQAYGVEFFIYLISVCCPEWLFRYSHTYLFKGKDFVIHPKINEGYEVHLVTVDDIGKLKNFHTTMAKAQDRLSRGDICIVTVRNADGSVIASLWASTGKLFSEYTGTFLDTDDNGLYLYSVNTIEEERDKGFYSNMLLFLIKYYNNINRFFIYSKVDYFNGSSINIKKKIGFKVIGESYAFKFYKFYACYYRYWHNFEDNHFEFYAQNSTSHFKLV